MQSRKHSHAEAATNVIVGGVVSWLLTIWIFGVTPHFALMATVVYAVASYLRSYFIRRLFNLWPGLIWNMSHRVPFASTQAHPMSRRLFSRLAHAARYAMTWTAINLTGWLPR